MKVGYILESRYCNLSYEEQKRDLENWGCDQIYGDKVDRYHYAKSIHILLRNLKEGDIVGICERGILGFSYGTYTVLKLIYEKKGQVWLIKENKSIENPSKIIKRKE